MTHYWYARDFTLDSIRAEVESVHGSNLKVTHIDKDTRKIFVRCTVCAFEYTTRRKFIVLNKKKCNVCANRAMVKTGTQATISAEEYQCRLDARYNGDVILVGAFTGHRKPRKHRCRKCSNEWVARRIGHCQLCSSRHGQASGQRKKEFQLGKRSVHVQGFEGLAIQKLLDSGVKPKNIRTTSDSNRPPVIEYTFRGKQRKHYPDIRVVRKDKGDVILEVKSTVTFGLTKFRKELRYFAKNKAKAKAAIAAGYDYRVMVMQPNGDVMRLPKNWYDLDLRTLLRQLKPALG